MNMCTEDFFVALLSKELILRRACSVRVFMIADGSMNHIKMMAMYHKYDFVPGKIRACKTVE